MPIVIGTDAYTDEVFATTYCAEQGLTVPAELEALLKRASVAIDRRYGSRFIGVRSVASQPLQWPRLPSYDILASRHDWYILDSFGNQREFTLIPPELAQANVEMAVLLEAGVDPYIQPDAVVQEYSTELGKLKETYKYRAVGHANNALYKIDLILAPLLRNGALIKLVR